MANQIKKRALPASKRVTHKSARCPCSSTRWSNKANARLLINWIDKVTVSISIMYHARHISILDDKRESIF